MAAAYATASDLALRWRPLSSSEQSIASTLLEDACAIIEAAIIGAPDPSSAPAIFKVVSCNMVRRAMEQHGDALGFTPEEMQEPAAWTEITPAGTLRLYNNELAMLEGALGGGSGSGSGGIIAAVRATRYV